ncbi:hypothetical protein EDC59_1217 [Pseudodesulfovibrio indicus]|uniref:Uncharacterized protein n=1 Tax=Pseudodesulfovibrio indicus TaxID=1716143 RepID=A0AA94PK02_9BACT|nr:hypothetical protein EDC59_1217 [Pseudodesulfovibrio indicus]
MAGTRARKDGRGEVDAGPAHGCPGPWFRTSWGTSCGTLSGQMAMSLARTSGQSLPTTWNPGGFRATVESHEVMNVPPPLMTKKRSPPPARASSRAAIRKASKRSPPSGVRPIRQTTTYPRCEEATGSLSKSGPRATIIAATSPHPTWKEPSACAAAERFSARQSTTQALSNSGQYPVFDIVPYHRVVRAFLDQMNAPEHGHICLRMEFKGDASAQYMTLSVAVTV